MALTLTTSPATPAFGETVTLLAESSLAADDAVQWELTSVPSKSALSLGLLVTPPPKVVRILSTPVTFVAKSTQRGHRATITRPSGSFVTAGLLAGMSLAIGGTASNDGIVTISAVEPQRLVLGPNDVLVAESIAATLTGTLQDPNRTPSNLLVCDVAGEYGLSAYEYVLMDMGPDGQHQKLVSVSTTTIHVGGFVELPIEPVNGHGSTLRLLVVNDTVRGAALVDPKTELARVAALDATVAASVAALVGVAVNSLDVDFTTDVNAICVLAAAHWLETHPVHVSADTTNTIVYETAYSMPSAMKRLNEVVKKHLSHQAATAIGGTWHAVGDDEKNVLQVSPEATSLTAATVLKADFRERVYRRHTALIASPASHGAVDSDNAPSLPVKTLPAVIRDYLDFIATEAPGAAAGEGEGIADAQAAWGFRAA